MLCTLQMHMRSRKLNISLGFIYEYESNGSVRVNHLQNHCNCTVLRKDGPIVNWFDGKLQVFT